MMKYYRFALLVLMAGVFAIPFDAFSQQESGIPVASVDTLEITSDTTVPFQADYTLSEQSDTIFDSQGIVIPPLFEYPTAPDDSPSLEARTNYLMDHFWDPFDFKNSKTVDQNALNHAFSVYAGAIPYANADKVKESVKNIISKIKNNPGLTYQFTRAAEENFYGQKASFWVDELYIPFLENLMANKKIDKNRKARYEEQLRILKATQPGQTMPLFSYTSRDGQKSSFRPSRDFTIIEFGNPECDDCHLAQFQLSISGAVKDMMEDGLLDVVFMIPDDESGELLPQTKSYPQDWIVGAADDVFEVLDIRATPTIYVLDAKGKIIAKNVAPGTAISIVEEGVKLQSNKDNK